MVNLETLLENIVNVLVYLDLTQSTISNVSLHVYIKTCCCECT